MVIEPVSTRSGYRNEIGNRFNSCNDSRKRRCIYLCGQRTSERKFDYEEKISNDSWLDDSGASCHMTNSDEGMYNCRNIKSPIKIGDGRTRYATKIGTKKLMVIQKDGSTLDITLEECKYVPSLWINLFSITKALGHKWNLSNKGQCIVLKKNSNTLMFDRLMQTDNGAVVGVIMKPKIDTIHMSIEKGRVVNINDFHKSMGHVNEESLRKTAQLYNIKLKGKLEKCYECSISKIKQRNVAKTTENKSEIPGERLFIDISSIKHLAAQNIGS
jgi:hypothetical protein